MKNLIVFDLDGTLAESKQKLSHEMATAIDALLRLKKVAVISGCSWKQFTEQFLDTFTWEISDNFDNMFLLPTCGTSMYRLFGDPAGWDNMWTQVYNNNLTMREKYKIYYEWNLACSALGINTTPGKWGEICEDRESQLTFSMLGQLAPSWEKNKWDTNGEIRKTIIANMILPDFDVRSGGSTSIDVTKKGMNKAYGIEQLKKLTGFTNEQILFIGDALQPGGNDYPVKEMGIDCIEVKSPEETIGLIRELIEKEPQEIL